MERVGQRGAMIDLHYAPTPNGWKISIMLEELGLPYKVIPVNVRAGEQFRPEFLAISPNNRIPAIVDHAPADGGGPFSVFETGAILIYLAEKTGRFLPTDMRGRSQALQWVMWQMGGLGPMLGQHGHFALYAPEKIPYAIERYRDEAARLYGVLDRQLGKTGAYIAGDSSIALTVERLRLNHTNVQATHTKETPHDRILLRLLQSLDLSRLSQHPAAGQGTRHRDFVAADPGWRHLQHGQPQRLCVARNAGAAEGALHEEGPRGLGALGGTGDQDAADGVSGEQREGDARLHFPRQGHGAVRA